MGLFYDADAISKSNSNSDCAGHAVKGCRLDGAIADGAN